jgi:hypothetical protein
MLDSSPLGAIQSARLMACRPPFDSRDLAYALKLAILAVTTT